ncbi:FKBP-type peptidyl-prolyl cis-trans isomerase [Mariniphaga anaerophila]|uniref:Peptidyl-prolyl cis-trans isomerase n=1 Tax=Mariniphaga anaerophila TaxID=1484053 RepID=A0A1M4T251_9BACT|nr:FKBP-type peptidyl-prolyl cis-trans isomerase [Mariniphaga anaerophila]SHE38546.1 FKBP-type peptidyl-prolyl cis-trans isomerase [Mariniphaga anaerophila]
MKMRLLINLVFATVVALAVSSCLKDGDEKVYTAAEEILLREAYLDSLVAKGHDIDTTANQVYYVIREEGEGDFAKSGDTLIVGYAGYFIDGVLFDSSELHYSDGKMEFVLEGEKSRMILGWEEGLKKMNKGAEFQFVIPSGQAYGSTGWGSIPPYQTLIFVTKLYDIKPS